MPPVNQYQAISAIPHANHIISDPVCLIVLRSASSAWRERVCG
jgi:hypothetical protein